MVESVIYLMSVTYIFSAFIIWKKTDEKLSFVNFFVVSIVLMLCYNMIVCFALNAIQVTASLKVLSLINIANASIILYFILKNKKTQKYYFNIESIVYIISIILMIIVMAFMIFGKTLNIRYVSTDSAVHFSNAREFYENGKLNGLVIGAYTNTGILFKVFAPFIGETKLYKVFLLFDIFLLGLMGFMMYAIVEKVINQKIYPITIFLILFFLMGYPFNTFIYGYVYLQLGIIMVAAIIAILQYSDIIKNKMLIYTFLMLSNFGLFFSYCLLVPAVYLTEFLFLINKNHKTSKKWISKENVNVILYTFGIPIICGLIYMVIPHLVSTNSENVFYSIEGYIYRNLWSNFVLLIPIAVSIYIKKNEDAKVWTCLFITQIILMIITYSIVKSFKLSTYYYYKFNFLLWFILWYGIIYSVNALNSKVANYLIVYILTYATIATSFIIFRRVEIDKEYYIKDENIIKAFDIYCTNNYVVKYFPFPFDEDEWELMEYVYYNIDLKKDNILIIGDNMKIAWFRAFFNYSNREDMQIVNPVDDIKKWNSKYYNYMLYFTHYNHNKYYSGKLKKGDLLLENPKGVIFKNK